jgi:hypothetical protein
MRTPAVGTRLVLVAGRVREWRTSAVVTVIMFVSLLAVAGWRSIHRAESHIAGGNQIACSCAVPPSARQLAAEADLVAAGTITAEQSDDPHGGTDYAFQISRVLVQHNENPPSTVTVHVSGSSGCCGSDDGPFVPNSQQVLFLTRTASGAFSTVHGTLGRLLLHDNTLTYYTYVLPPDHAETLDELAAQLAGP